MAEHEKDLDSIANEIEQMITLTPGCRPDYVSFVDEETFEPAITTQGNKTYRLLLAMYSGKVRLIDNAKILA